MLLEPVLQSLYRYTVKDSFTFAEDIGKLNSENTFMSTFDAKSLFTKDFKLNSRRGTDARVATFTLVGLKFSFLLKTQVLRFGQQRET